MKAKKKAAKKQVCGDPIDAAIDLALKCSKTCGLSPDIFITIAIARLAGEVAIMRQVAGTLAAQSAKAPAKKK